MCLFLSIININIKNNKFSNIYFKYSIQNKNLIYIFFILIFI